VIEISKLAQGLCYLLKKNSDKVLTAGVKMMTAAAALIKPKAKLTICDEAF
jgi:hypothetical protein